MDKEVHNVAEAKPMRGRMPSPVHTRPIQIAQHSVRVATFLLVLVGSMMWVSPAYAYRTAADDLELSLPMGRAEHTVQVLVGASSTGISAPGLMPEVVASAFELAAGAWTTPARECGAVEILVLGTSTTEANPFDGITSVTVVTEGWEARGYAATQAAITELRFSDLPDQLLITDADIFINADTIDWSLPGAPDLQAVALHELGHAAFGLSHNCGDAGAPTCSGALEAAAIMFPEYQAGAHEPRADDVAGACAVVAERPCDVVTCDADAYCQAGRCVPANRCEDGTSCGSDVCAIAGPAAGMCSGPDGEGAPCASGDDCATRLCLTVPRESESYCTRTCSEVADCAPGQACRMVGEVFVCAPPPPATCAASGRGTNPAPLSILSFLPVLVLGLRGRRLGGLR